MTVFEFRTSDAGSNPSINWATTTAPIPTSFWDSNKFTDFWQMLVWKVAFIKPWYGSSLDCYLLGFLSGFTAIPPLRNLIRRLYAILTVRTIVKFPANPVIKIFAKKSLLSIIQRVQTSYRFAVRRWSSTWASESRQGSNFQLRRRARRGHKARTYQVSIIHDRASLGPQLFITHSRASLCPHMDSKLITYSILVPFLKWNHKLLGYIV